MILDIKKESDIWYAFYHLCENKLGNESLALREQDLIALRDLALKRATEAAVNDE